MENNTELEQTKKVFSKDQLVNLANDAINTLDTDPTKEMKHVSHIIKEEVTKEKVEEIDSESITEKNDEMDIEDIELKTPKKKLKKIFIIIPVVVLLLIGLFLTLYFVIFKKHKKEEPKNNDVIIAKKNYRYENGSLIFLDGNKEIGSYKCNNKSVTNCYVANYSNTEDDLFVARLVYEDLKPVSEQSDFINNQYAFIVDDKNAKTDNILIYDFINNKNMETIKGVKYYNDDNYVIIKDKNNQYSLYMLNTDGIKNSTNNSYEYLTMINEGDNSALIAKTNGKWSLIEHSGTEVSKPIMLPIRSFNSEYIVAGETGAYYLYNYKGNQVFKKSYSFIELLDEYVITINDLDLKVLDYEGNQYNQVPVELKSSEYIIKYIYNDKGSKVGTRGSYQSSIKDDTLTITIMDDKNTKININLLEGKLNKNLKYINYNNGVLYFYNDEEKTSLIGSYTCTNKNTINGTDDVLDNCYIASDSIYENNDVESNDDKTIGVIPIINNKYVFISDNAITANKKLVKLYDLTTSKVIGSYQNVCSYLFSGINELSFAMVDDLNILARNKDGKMGLIRINGNEISNGILFNYLSIEKMGKYYLAKQDNAKYVLIDQNSLNVVSKETNQIKGYNEKYLKVIEGNKYYIYDYEGNKISNTGYKYIELADDYYAAVNDSNYITLYNYDNEQIISEEVKLNSNKYTDKIKPSFILNKLGIVVTISILSGDNYLDYSFDTTTGSRVEG